MSAVDCSDVIFEFPESQSNPLNEMDIDAYVEQMFSQNTTYRERPKYELRVREYLNQLTEIERMMCNVARNELGDAFSIIKSNNFIDWKNATYGTKDDLNTA